MARSSQSEIVSSKSRHAVPSVSGRVERGLNERSRPLSSEELGELAKAVKFQQFERLESGFDSMSVDDQRGAFIKVLQTVCRSMLWKYLSDEQKELINRLLRSFVV